MLNLLYATKLVACEPPSEAERDDPFCNDSLRDDLNTVLHTQVLQQQQWKQLLIQTHREPLDVGPTLMNPVPHTQIILRTSGYSSAQLTTNGITYRFKPHPGALFLTAAHQEPYEYQRSRLSDQPVHTIHLYVDNRLLVQTAAELTGIDENRVELCEGSCLNDPLLSQLTYSLGEELERAGTINTLFSETAAQLLAVQLLRQHSSIRHVVSEHRGKLTANCRKQLTDYINAHLDQSIPLDSLAAIACMSAYHFCRVFKRTLGVSPNRYVINQRLERAQHLLRRGMPVAQVAQAVGYTSANHFSQLFLRLTGCLPSHYQKACS